MLKSVMRTILFLLLMVSYEIVAAQSEKSKLVLDGENASQRRHVVLEGQSNFRDIGGYKTSSDKTVKWGQVYRSGELPRLTDKDVSKLKALGVKKVVNFLTEEETKNRGKDRLPCGVSIISQPIESDDGLVRIVSQARKNADFSKVPADLNPQFHGILVNDAKKQYAALLKEIAKADGQPVVFHCSHGVHRTGTATAILLWTLDVPWQTIREDYLLSNKCRKTEIEKRLAQLRQQAARYQKIPPEKVDMTNINAFYILKGNYIDATRDEILKQYGSIDRYLIKGLGLKKSEIQALRDNLLE
ncbi:MAG: tyrosine-protein phosphatase [Gimesia sp.]|nr:tyrosine-protein phosphatase [Gimesia sp.]